MVPPAHARGTGSFSGVSGPRAALWCLPRTRGGLPEEGKMQVKVTSHPFAYWCEGCESESVVYVEEGCTADQSIQCPVCGLCAAELTGPVESLIEFDDEEEPELIKCPVCGAEF